jgi:hypothetical protein
MKKPVILKTYRPKPVRKEGDVIPISRDFPIAMGDVVRSSEYGTLTINGINGGRWASGVPDSVGFKASGSNWVYHGHTGKAYTSASTWADSVERIAHAK